MSTYTIKYGDTLSSIARNAGLTTQDVMRLNPSITDPNKIYSGRVLNLSAAPAPYVPPSAPTPIAPGQTNPVNATIKQVADRIPGFTEDPTLSKIGQGYKDASTQTVDEEAVRREVRDRFQGQIDAINQIYEGKKAEARVQGQGRQGTTNAINARSGLIGSDFGVANTNNTEQYNNEILSNIDSEKGAKISALYDILHRDASAEIAAKRTAIEQGAQKYLEYLSTTDARKKAAASNVAKALYAKGIDPSQLTPDEISKITSTYNMTAEDFTALYNEAKTSADKAKGDALKANSFELTDGQAKYTLDPLTGKATLVAENTKNFAPNKYSGVGTGTPGTGTGGGTARGTGVTPTGQVVKIGKQAQDIIDLINTKGGTAKDYILGSNKESNSLLQEVNAGLNGQKGGIIDAGSRNATINNIQNTINTLLTDNKAGSFRVRNADNKWLNPTANDATNFVANTTKLKNALLALDGPSIKSIFGPQISNSDIDSIKLIIASGLDPINQDSKAFETSIRDIQNKLQLTGRVQGASPTSPTGSGKIVEVINPRNGSISKTYESNVPALQAKGWTVK